MYEIDAAADLYDMERSYRGSLLKKMVAAIRPGEQGRIWGPQSFPRQRPYKNN